MFQLYSYVDVSSVLELDFLSLWWEFYRYYIVLWLKARAGVLYICFWLDSVLLYELSFLHLSCSSLFYFVWNTYMLLMYISAWVMYHILTSQSSSPALQSDRCSQSVGIPGCYKGFVKTLLHQQRLHPFLSYTKVSFAIEFLDLELARRNVNLRHITFSPTLCSDTNCSQNLSICNTCKRRQAFCNTKTKER